MFKNIIFVVLFAFCLGCTNNQKGIESEDNENSLYPSYSDKQKSRYYFEHKLLPKLFFSNPEKMIHNIQSQGSNYLKDIFYKLDVNSERKGKLDYFNISVDSVNFNNNLISLIRLPHPVVPTESYYLSMVIADYDKTKEAKYFTLEKIKPDFNNKPDEAVFCGWTKSGQHINYGIGMSGIPTQDDFVYVINKAINGEIQPKIGIGFPN